MVAMPDSAEQRLRMAACILDFEARRDAAGHLKVYALPANDGGGAYEVAGINQRYDREACDALIKMIGEGQFNEAEIFATEYIAKNTDPAAGMTSVPMIESYLRDCVFNRGVRGATRILRRALKVADDGIIGPETRAAMQSAERDPEALLQDLRAAREDYEKYVVGYRANFWGGLVSRWNKSMLAARKFSKVPTAQPKPPPSPAQPPAPRNWLSMFIDAIAAIFRRR